MIYKNNSVYFSQITFDKQGMMIIKFNQNLTIPDFAQVILKLNANITN